jgi:hypothetical protein
MQNEETDLIKLAAKFVNSTASHIFLTGKAGTGKTTFLKNLALQTHKSFVIIAPTGIAALNAQGVTIHSQFLFPMGSFVPVKDSPGNLGLAGNFFTQTTLASRHPLNSVRKQVLRAADLIIIDEVSMLRADLLDAIDYRMRSVKGNFNRSFGGAQLLMIGDLFQLPPIVKPMEWSVLRSYYKSMHFFESLAIRQSGMVYIELDKIFRQQDQSFIQILNNLRNNIATEQDINKLNSYFRTEEEIGFEQDVVTITTHNHKADSINKKELENLPGPSSYFEAEVIGDFPENLFPILETIELKVGAQVMFVKNDASGEANYFNGKLARVDYIDDEGVTVIMADSHVSYILRQEHWENKKYKVDENSKELEEEVVGSFTQFPVKLAWAVTVHKSQGLTFDKAIIDVGQAFAPGQVYVALSRLRSLDGLILRTKIQTSAISNDHNVVSFSKEKNQKDLLPLQLEKEQANYLQRLLASSFDFANIENQLGFFNTKKRGKLEFEEESLRNAVPEIKESFLDEKINTAKFRNQLIRLVQEGEFKQLDARLEKGALYYSSFLQLALKKLLNHAAQVEQFTQTKTYLAGISELDQLIMNSWRDVERAAEMCACILEKRDIIRQDKKHEKRIQARLDWYEEARGKVEVKPSISGRKTGRKRKSSGKKEKGETYKITYALIKEGMGIKEISLMRELADSTIESHIVKGISEGEVDVKAVLGADDVKVISETIKNSPASLSLVHDAFNAKYTYNQLRMVQAHLRA